MVMPNASDAIAASDFLEVGRIVGVQGLKGEVRVYPSSDFPERFTEPGRRWLRRAGQTEPQPVELKAGRYLAGKGLYVVQLAEINDRTQAEALRDSTLLVLASDRPHLEDDEFHVPDLIGLMVVDQSTQVPIGTVIGVIPAGNDLLEVQRSDTPADQKPATVLIPFVKEIVPIVDLAQRRIEVNPPKGLLE